MERRAYLLVGGLDRSGERGGAFWLPVRSNLGGMAGDEDSGGRTGADLRLVGTNLVGAARGIEGGGLATAAAGGDSLEIMPTDLCCFSKHSFLASMCCVLPLLDLA